MNWGTFHNCLFWNSWIISLQTFFDNNQQFICHVTRENSTLVTAVTPIFYVISENTGRVQFPLLACAEIRCTARVKNAAWSYHYSASFLYLTCPVGSGEFNSGTFHSFCMSLERRKETIWFPCPSLIPPQRSWLCPSIAFPNIVQIHFVWLRRSLETLWWQICSLPHPTIVGNNKDTVMHRAILIRSTQEITRVTLMAMCKS